MFHDQAGALDLFVRSLVGMETLFTTGGVDEPVRVLDAVRANAIAA